MNEKGAARAADGLLPGRRQGVTRRRALASLSAGAGAATLAAGCGLPGSSSAVSPAKVTQATNLLYWTNLGGADGAKMKELVEQYRKETPLVTVDDIQGVPNYLEKFVAAAVAGSPPEVLGTRMLYVPNFAEKNLLFDFSTRELQQLGMRPEEFEPTVWRAGEYKGKRLSIPMDINGYMLLLNTAAVRDGGLDPAKPPITWTDLQEWVSRLTQGERHGGQLDSNGEGVIWQFQHHIRQTGGELFSADGKKAAFNNTAGLTAMTFMADLFQRANLPLPTNALDAFEQRKLATWIGGPWNFTRLAYPSSPAFNDVAAVFAPQRDPSKPSWWAHSFQLALPRQDKPDDAKRTASFAFIRWLVEHSLDWATAGKLPASKKVLASEAWQKSTHPVHQLLRLWERSLPSARFVQLHPKYVDVVPVLQEALANGVQRKVSPQACLTEAETAVNALLAQ